MSSEASHHGEPRTGERTTVYYERKAAQGWSHTSTGFGFARWASG
jgi:hypothetical protein